MLNPDTRVAVVCYAGDQQQVEQVLDFYTHHECPVTILSPENSKVVINHPQVNNRHAGKRAQYGADANARMLAHLKILLEYPENHFFMNESDSLCLDPKLPDYLYAEPDTVWNNGGPAMPYNAAKWPGEGPALSFQAPWFLSRKTIEAFVGAADRVISPTPSTGDRNGARDWWVDLYLAQLTQAAGLHHDYFRDRYLGPISGRYDNETGMFFDPMAGNDPNTGYFLDPSAEHKPYNQHLIDTYEGNLKMALGYVEHGACMIHSVKNPVAAKALLAAYRRKEP